MTANSTYWIGDREPDGLGYVEMKRSLVLAIGVFGVTLRVTAGGRFPVEASGFWDRIIVCRCQGGVQKPIQPAGRSLPEV